MANSPWDFLSNPPQQGQDFSSMLLAPSQAPAPSPMLQSPNLPLANVNVPNPANVNAKTKGAIIKSEVTGKQDNKTSSTNKKYLDPEAFQSLYSMIGESPDVKAQKESLDKMDADLAMQQQGLPDQTNYGWVKPLLSYVDSTQGTNLSAGFTPGMSAKDQMSTLTKYRDDVQKRRGELSKTILDAIPKLVSGQDQTSQQNMINQMLMNSINNSQGNGTLGSARMLKLPSEAGASFDKDPILKQVTNTTNSLDRAKGIMDGKTPVTGKNFALLQQDMINAMAPGGAATEGKVNREMVETLASKLNDLQQKFGNIQDLRKEQPEQFAQLKGLIDQVQEDYNKAGLSRAKELELNFGHVDNDAVRATVKDKMDALSKKFMPAPKPGSQPKRIVQNGHTYNLNETTGKYE